MKTKSIQPIVLLVFALMLSMPTRGQDGDEPKISGGAKILGNTSFSKGTTSAFGYGAGAYINFNLFSFMTIRGELLYVSYASGLTSYQDSLGSGATARIIMIVFFDFTRQRFQF
jgi:hypothetical protein